MEALFEKMRKIPNWPEEGILFHDITPILQSPQYFRLLVDLLVYRYMDQKVDVWPVWTHAALSSVRPWLIS